MGFHAEMAMKEEKEKEMEFWRDYCRAHRYIEKRLGIPVSLRDLSAAVSDEEVVGMCVGARGMELAEMVHKKLTEEQHEGM